MKRFLIPGIALVAFTAMHLHGVAGDMPGKQLVNSKAKYGFIENKGQIIDQNNKPNPSVLYLLNTPGMNVQLRKTGFSYDVYSVTESQSHKVTESQDSSLESRVTSFASRVTSFHRIDIDLQNANPTPVIETSAASKDYLNYYTTGTHEEGVTLVKSFGGITYKNIYPGIDLQFTNNDGIFEYNFLIQPGADIASIKLKVAGPEKIKSYKEKIRMVTSVGDIDETIPLCYYSLNNIQVPVKGRFKKIADNLYGFSVDQAIPNGAVLLIDPIPTRRWGTYFGGTNNDISQGFDCVTDNSGNIVICGSTRSTSNIATAGSFQTVLSSSPAAFLAKFSSSGQQLWGTYYGGDNLTEGYSCDVDQNGNIFIVGRTSSTTVIATPGAFQPILRGPEDGFVAKFTSSGSRLWGTYYGGNQGYLPSDDWFFVCSTDSAGAVYCAGETVSPDFIATPGATQTILSGQIDGTLVKFTADGQRVWGTYYGGTSYEGGISTTVSKNGFVYLSGTTYSPNNIATPGSFMPVYNGSASAFLACFNLDGTRLWGTYFNGEAGTFGNGCTADTGSSVYFYGYTNSATNIATTGVYQTSLSESYNGFIEKFDSSGNRLWGSYYGPTNLQGAAVDDSGFVYFTGGVVTQDTLVYSAGAYQKVIRGSGDAFLAKFTGDGQRVWGTYYGGMNLDEGSDCAVDHNDNIYLYGGTQSDNNPDNNTSPCTRNPLANYIASPGGHQRYYGGNGDVYLVKFADCYSPDTATQINGLSEVCVNTSGVIYSIAPIVAATDYHWCVSGNLTITAGQNSTSVTVNVGPVAGTDTISVYGINSCDNGFPKSLLISVLSRPAPTLTGTTNVCPGENITYNTETGKTGYVWNFSAGGTKTGGGNSSNDFISVTWNTPGAQRVSVNYTETNGCAAGNPTQLDVDVSAGFPVNVTITASQTQVCTGTSVTLTATPTNPGTLPVYQWKVNGIDAGTNDLVFTYTPVNGDVVTCLLTSSILVCVSNNPATSNPIVMVVNPILPVSLSISATSNPVCTGTAVTFTAAPNNEGLTPAYQWKVNGSNVGIGLPTYTYIPASGDLVSCILTSSMSCVTGNPATATPITMTVNSQLPVGVTITVTASPVCEGTPVTFSASPTNPGGTPIYQWRVNDVDAGINSQFYTMTPANNDQVKCILTSSMTCVTGNPATSLPILMNVAPTPAVTFTTCFDTITTLNAKPIKLRGGIPYGGTYSGPGVNSATGVFTTSVAGTGTKTITYSYTNIALCSVGKNKTIMVQANPAFTCGNNLTDIRDNKVYPTVQIGTQCWMQANLDFGIEISDAAHQTDNCIVEKYISHASLVTRHAFYQWDEVMRYDPTPGLQGLCPPGWHVPDETEWNTLFNFCLGNARAGYPLQDQFFNGFKAQQNGVYYLNSMWSFTDFATLFWSSTMADQTRAYAHGMNTIDQSVSVYAGLKANGFSVRCFRD